MKSPVKGKVTNVFFMIFIMLLETIDAAQIAKGTCKSIRFWIVKCEIPNTRRDMNLQAVVLESMGPGPCVEGLNYLITKNNHYLMVKHPCQAKFSIQEVTGDTTTPTTPKTPSITESSSWSTDRPTKVPTTTRRTLRPSTTTVPTTTTTTTTRRPNVYGCGRKRPAYRIIGGSKSKQCQFPWMVVVYDRKDHRLCGGSIIDSTTILTAGHCLSHYTTNGYSRYRDTTKPENLRILSGSYKVPFGREDRDVEDDAAMMRKYMKKTRVSKVTVHPSFDVPKDTLVHDIAIVKLAEPLPLDDCHVPVCLPDGTKTPYQASGCLTMGWGTTSNSRYAGVQRTMRHTNVTIASWRQCWSSYKKMSTAKTFCAGGDGHDSCQGDSGGPLVCRDSGSYFQYGIVSAGFDGQCGQIHGLYTRTSAYLDWIENNRD